MILRTRGRACNIDKHIVAGVTRRYDKADSNTILLADGGSVDLESTGDFLAVITTSSDIENLTTQSIVSNVPSLGHLEEGDIVSVSSDGVINTLYRVNSNHNTLLATERCNSNCLMCSQPPRDRNDVPLLFDIYKKLIPLIPKDCIELGVSGGEPTLMGDHFFDLMQILKDELPNTEIHVLTNGRSFAWNHMAERLSLIGNGRLMLGIPLYSDFYQIHDYVVQANNAYYQTILGLHNLARYNQRIEIRVVLHKLTLPRLMNLAKYIYKNLPFAEHVAFMGLEYIGYTPRNIDKLWIDPYEYKEELADVVEYLSSQGLNISIYNTPLCVLPERVWSFARKSISDWKNDYLPECQMCSKLNYCGGLFTWNLKKHSEYIRPIY